jgi:2-hydroxycyclohexanecarboxyl-CoA dehydrogenase
MMLDGHLALVTGGAGGIGSAICRRLAAEGARVAVADVSEDAGRAVAREVGGSFHRLDITDAGAAVELAARLGTVQVLVNNAGWDRVMPFLDTTPDFWERNLRLNLYGGIAVTHAVARGMVERRTGRIVTIASDAGRVGSSGETVYAAAKGGLIAFTKSLARELARHGITVNCVCPGPVDTPFLDAFEGERGARILEVMTRSIPMRRRARPEEIAGAVAFLAGEDAAYITGQALSVDGGLVMA